MSNFYIKDIYIKNFRGYNGEKEYYFTDAYGKPNNIILLSGPNGYGKTTLLDSIEWCLTGNIKRVKDDYLKRCPQKGERGIENSSRGLIYNVNSQEKHVIVRINAIYNDEDVTISREFNGVDEFEALEQEQMPTIACKKDIEDELLELVKHLRKSFNYEHICSYNKNIETYSKGRTDIYDFFESSFSEFSEVKKIIENLNILKTNLNNRKDALDESLSNLHKNKDDKEVILKTLNEVVKISQYPKEVLFKSEIFLDDKIINQVDDEIDLKLNKQVQVLSEMLYAKIIKFLSVIIDKNKILIEKEQLSLLKNKYQSEKEKIDIIKDLSFEELIIVRTKLSDFYQYAKSLISIDNVYRFMEELKSDKSIYRNLLDESIFINISEIFREFKKNKEIQNVLNKEKELYSSDSPIIKAMRYIVDNESVYNGYKEENDLCPLCGHKGFSKSEIGVVAKEFLGSKDIKRQDIIREIQKYDAENLIIVKNIYDNVLHSLENKIKDISEKITLKEELADIYILINSLDIDIKSLSKELIYNREILLEEKLSKLQINNEDEKYIISLLNGLNEPFLLICKNDIQSYINTEYQKNIDLLKNVISQLQKNIIILDDIDVEEAYEKSELSIIKEKLDITKSIIVFKNSNHLNNEIKDINDKMKIKNEELVNISKKINRVTTLVSKVNKIKTEREKNETERIAEPLSIIYKKIIRNTNIKEINLKKGVAKNKSSLDVKDFEGNDIPFGNILSAGQVSTLAISMYFAKAILNKNSKFKLYLMDDPIQTMDDLNVISLIDILRFQFKEIKENRFIDQLFISTCDEDIEKLIMHKMRSFDVPIYNQSFTIK